MTDLREAAERMIAALFPCRCEKTYTGRGRHEPGCLATDAKDSAEELANGLAALAESDIARLEAENKELRARLAPPWLDEPDGAGPFWMGRRNARELVMIDDTEPDLHFIAWRLGNSTPVSRFPDGCKFQRVIEPENGK